MKDYSLPMIPKAKYLANKFLKVSKISQLHQSAIAVGISQYIPKYIETEVVSLNFIF